MSADKRFVGFRGGAVKRGVAGAVRGVQGEGEKFLCFQAQRLFLSQLPVDSVKEIMRWLSWRELEALWHTGDEEMRKRMVIGVADVRLGPWDLKRHLTASLSVVMSLRGLRRLSLMADVTEGNRALAKIDLEALPSSLVELELAAFTIQHGPALAWHLPRLKRLCLVTPLQFPTQWPLTLPTSLECLALQLQTPQPDLFLTALSRLSRLACFRAVIWLSRNSDLDTPLPSPPTTFSPALTTLSLAYHFGTVLDTVLCTSPTDPNLDLSSNATSLSTSHSSQNSSNSSTTDSTCPSVTGPSKSSNPSNPSNPSTSSPTRATSALPLATSSTSMDSTLGPPLGLEVNPAPRPTTPTAGGHSPTFSRLAHLSPSPTATRRSPLAVRKLAPAQPGQVSKSDPDEGPPPYGISPFTQSSPTPPPPHSTPPPLGILNSPFPHSPPPQRSTPLSPWPATLTSLQYPLPLDDLQHQLRHALLPSPLTALDLGASAAHLTTPLVAQLPRTLLILGGTFATLDPAAYAQLPPALTELRLHPSSTPSAADLTHLPQTLTSLRLSSLELAHLPLLPTTLTLLDAPISFSPIDALHHPADLSHYLPLLHGQAINPTESPTFRTLFPPHLTRWSSGTYPAHWILAHATLQLFTESGILFPIPLDEICREPSPNLVLPLHAVHISSTTPDLLAPATHDRLDANSPPHHTRPTPHWQQVLFPSSLTDMTIITTAPESLVAFPCALRTLNITMEAPNRSTQPEHLFDWAQYLPPTLTSLTFTSPGRSQIHRQLIQSLPKSLITLHITCTHPINLAHQDALFVLPPLLEHMILHWCPFPGHFRWPFADLPTSLRSLTIGYASRPGPSLHIPDASIPTIPRDVLFQMPDSDQHFFRNSTGPTHPTFECC